MLALSKKSYRGVRTPSGCQVRVYTGHKLPDPTEAPSNDPISMDAAVEWRTLPTRYGKEHGYVSHSPDGFEWGYGGSGPSQLAFAMTFDVVQDADRAHAAYITVRNAIVAQLVGDTWEVPASKVLAVVKQFEAAEKKRRQAWR